MKLNFEIYFGFVIVILGGIILYSHVAEHFDGIQTHEKISIAYDNNVVSFSNIFLNFVTNNNTEYINIDYAILRNESKAGFIAIVIPYNGNLVGMKNGWNEQPILSSNSVVLFKKFDYSNNTSIGSDQANLYFQLSGTIESFTFPSSHLEIPFANNPLDPELTTFINKLSPIGPNFTFGWGKIESAYVEVTIDKSYDEWNPQPPVGITSITNPQGGNNVVLQWKITDNNPLYSLVLTRSKDRFQEGFDNTIAGAFIAVGVSMEIYGVEKIRSDWKQRRLERFIEMQEHMQEGNTAFLLKDYSTAKNAYDSASKIDLKKIDPILLAGNSFFGLKKYRDALPYYEKILVLQSDHIGALNNIGVCYDRLGDPEKAFEYYEKVLTKDPNHLDALNNMGALISDQGFPEISLLYYEEALKINPDDLVTLTNKGKSLAELKQYNDSILCFDRVLSLDQKYTDALIGKGRAFFDMTDYQNAILCYQRILQIDPTQTSILYNLGTSYLRLDDYENTIKYISEYLITDSYNIDALSNKGIALAKQEKHSEAMKFYSLIFDLQQDHADTLYNMALSLMLIGESRSAIPYFQKYLIQRPKEIVATINLGNCYLNIKNPEEATKYFQKVMDLDPYNTEAIKMMSIAREQMKKSKQND